MGQLEYRDEVDRFAAVLHAVFLRAKESDEWEYACTLLRVSGMSDAGWDPLDETAAMFRDIGGLLSSPLRPDTKLRLGLLLYSHLVEVDAVHEVLYNMLRVISGERFHTQAFGDLYRRPKNAGFLDRGVPPSAKTKLRQIKDNATKLSENALVEALDYMFNDAVRNAFFHSDYTIHKLEFRSHKAWFEHEDGYTRSPSLSRDEISAVVNRGVAFYEAFTQVMNEHIQSYGENVVVWGRFNHETIKQPMLLLADSEMGLYGWQSINEDGSPGSSLFKRYLVKDDEEETENEG